MIGDMSMDDFRSLGISGRVSHEELGTKVVEALHSSHPNDFIQSCFKNGKRKISKKTLMVHHKSKTAIDLRKP